MTTTTLLLVLARVLHIFGGVIWAGSMFALSFGVMPVGRTRGAVDGGVSLRRSVMT